MIHQLIIIPDILNELSDESFARYMLYTQADAVKSTGNAYSAAFASSYNADLPRLLRKGRVNVCVFSPDTQGLPDGPFYMQSEKIVDRVLGYKLAADEKLGTMEEMTEKLCQTPVDYAVIKPENEKVFPIRDEEAKLLEAEAYNTAAAVLTGAAAETAFFKDQWLNLITDGTVSADADAICAAAKAALGKDLKDIFRLGSDNIEITALKMCEDGSGDVVLRVNETKGLDEVHSFIMSDIFDMGFRFDIAAYETKTFRVNADGMVRETNFAEGIIPFNHFEW